MDKTKMQLSSAKVGECMTVNEISGNATARLFDLGFFLGARVRYLGRAPLGDPMMFSVGGRVIAVRKRDLTSIIVWK